LSQKADSIHRCADVSTAALLYFMIVFTPWAFGTTQAWSIWTMNLCGYVLGCLLVVKWICRWQSEPVIAEAEQTSHLGGWLTRCLAVLTVVIVGYCLCAAVNARAKYDLERLAFEYYENYLPWLPHSYDRDRSFALFWNYLGLALAFWAIRDWLVNDRRSHPEAAQYLGRTREPIQVWAPPQRLTRLLWVLVINGALLAMEGLIQRADGGAKLLWIMETRINREATSQFGPYAYRSNAAQYFNLLWPAVLGFWCWREQAARRERGDAGTHRILIPLIVLIAVCPIISLSRAGAIVTLINVIAASAVVMLSVRRLRRRMAAGIGIAIAVIVCATLFFNGSELLKRFATSSKDFYEGRELTYQTAKGMLRDYPVFGTGPGTFEHVFQLYRKNSDEYWPAQLHNDWLETAITFGWLGFGLIGAAFLLILAAWFIPGQIRAPWAFIAMLWISLAGCLIHARVDFPFQIYSTLFFVILLCAILFSFSKSHRCTDAEPALILA